MLEAGLDQVNVHTYFFNEISTANRRLVLHRHPIDWDAENLEIAGNLAGAAWRTFGVTVFLSISLSADFQC